jgi:hypothetical protein
MRLVDCLNRSWDARVEQRKTLFNDAVAVLALLATYVGLAKFGVNVSIQVVMVVVFAEFLLKSVVDLVIFGITTLGFKKHLITTDGKLKPFLKSMIAQTIVTAYFLA